MKLIFEDAFKKLIWSDSYPKAIFQDLSRKLVFDALITAEVPTTCSIGTCIIGSTFTVG